MLYMEYNSYRGSITFASTACKQDLILFDCGMFIGAQKVATISKMANAQGQSWATVARVYQQ